MNYSLTLENCQYPKIHPEIGVNHARNIGHDTIFYFTKSSYSMEDNSP